MFGLILFLLLSCFSKVYITFVRQRSLRSTFLGDEVNQACCDEPCLGRKFKLHTMHVQCNTVIVTNVRRPICAVVGKRTLVASLVTQFLFAVNDTLLLQRLCAGDASVMRFLKDFRFFGKVWLESRSQRAKRLFEVAAFSPLSKNSAVFCAHKRYCEITLYRKVSRCMSRGKPSQICKALRCPSVQTCAQ